MAPIGLSSAVQGAVFCFANLFVQADINRFGAAAIAGSTIATNFEYFGYFFITAFGQAAATFTSQNAAAGKWARCRRVLRLSIGCAAGVRILHILAFEPLCGLYEVPSGVMRGTEHAVLPAVLTILGTCLLRIVWSFTVFEHFGTPESLYIVFPVSWCVTAALIWAGYAVIQPLKEPACPQKS